MNTQTELQPAFPVFTTVYQYIIIIKKTVQEGNPHLPQPEGHL